MVVQIAGGIFGSLLVAGLVPGSYIGEAHLSETNPLGYKVPLPQAAPCTELTALLLDLESNSLLLL